MTSSSIPSFICLTSFCPFNHEFEPCCPCRLWDSMSSCRCLHANKNTLCSSPQPVKLLLSAHKKGPHTPEIVGCPGTACPGCDPAEIHMFPFSHVNTCSTHTALKAHRECQALSKCVQRLHPEKRSPHQLTPEALSHLPCYKSE